MSVAAAGMAVSATKIAAAAMDAFVGPSPRLVQ
jgi:hypothetical protein